MSKLPIIEVQNVNKQFKINANRKMTMRGAFVNLLENKQKKIFQALENINFSVYPGEFISIIGHNGSGKSTLLNILANIYQPDSGKIHTTGKIAPFLGLGIGMMPELSGLDNIYLNGVILGLTKNTIDEKLNSILDFADIGNFINVPMNNYSSGMKVRLAFATLMHADGDIFLMDEVLAVGDENFQKKCLAKFDELISKNKTIIFVSHSSSAVLKYSHKVLLLHHGQQKAFTTPSQALALYADLMNETQMAQT